MYKYTYTLDLSLPSLFKIKSGRTNNLSPGRFFKTWNRTTALGVVKPMIYPLIYLEGASRVLQTRLPQYTVRVFPTKLRDHLGGVLLVVSGGFELPVRAIVICGRHLRRGEAEARSERLLLSTLFPGFCAGNHVGVRLRLRLKLAPILGGPEHSVPGF